jgi:hypothetical protein
MRHDSIDWCVVQVPSGMCLLLCVDVVLACSVPAFRCKSVADGIQFDLRVRAHFVGQCDAFVEDSFPVGRFPELKVHKSLLTCIWYM